MDLDNFKQEWQAQPQIFVTQDGKPLSEIQQLVHSATGSLLQRMLARYGKLITFPLISVLLFIVTFYTISEGFTNPNDSLNGLIFGVVVLLTIPLIFWQLYQRAAGTPMGGSVRQNLEQLIARLRRNRVLELGYVGLLTVIMLLPRFVSGRGFGDLSTELWIMLALSSGVIATYVWWIVRTYRQQLAQLEELLTRLVGE